MSPFLSLAADLDSTLQFTDQTSLVFVDEADYEFVGGGASVINGA